MDRKLIKKMFQMLCFFVNEIERDEEIDLNTCEFTDEEGCCGCCEETLCQITQDAKKLIAEIGPLLK